MDAERWWQEHEQRFPREPGVYLDQLPRVSYFEAVFFRRVLAQLPGDDFEFDYTRLHHQRETRNRGGSYFVDFTIEEPGGAPIAIEVDGFYKGADGSTVYDQFTQFLERQNALIADGWTVQRFSNRWMDSNPGECVLALRRVIQAGRSFAENAGRIRETNGQLAEELRRTQERVRDQARELSNRGEAELRAKGEADATIEGLRRELATARGTRGAELEQQIVHLQEQSERRLDDLMNLQATLEKQRTEVEVLRQQLAAQITERGATEHQTIRSEVEHFASQQTQDLDHLRSELHRRIEVLDRQLAASLRRLDEAKRRERMVRYVTAGFITVALAAVVVTLSIVLLLTNEDASRTSPSSTSQAVDCASASEWGFMISCDGKRVTAKGPVAGASYQASVNGKPTYLNIGNDFPNKSRLEVVIWGDCRNNFTPPPESAYRGKTLYVTGTVSVREGVPQISVCSPNQITVER